MKSYSEILQQVNTYHELGATIDAVNFVVTEYNIKHPNLKGFELREKASADFILMTTEGTFGASQIIRIPENTFEFEFNLMVNLLAHEMVHVGQKELGNCIEDKNEREWQAYYEMLFHKIYPQIPPIKDFHRNFFGNKALEYYNRMGNGSFLQEKYAAQKKEVEDLLANIIL
jgi:hypothetical protein